MDVRDRRDVRDVWAAVFGSDAEDDDLQHPGRRLEDDVSPTRPGVDVSSSGPNASWCSPTAPVEQCAHVGQMLPTARNNVEARAEVRSPSSAASSDSDGADLRPAKRHRTACSQSSRPAPCDKASQGSRRPPFQWVTADAADGLWLCRSLLSQAEQQTLLQQIEAEQWFDPPSRNQAMRFGSLPDCVARLGDKIHQAVLSWYAANDPAACTEAASSSTHEPSNTATHCDPHVTDPCCSSAAEVDVGEGAAGEKEGEDDGEGEEKGEGEGEEECEAEGGEEGVQADGVQGKRVSMKVSVGPFKRLAGLHRRVSSCGGSRTMCCGPFPPSVVNRKPLFDQMIANWYSPHEGIKPHVDLMRFDDGIAIVSLKSKCVMTLARLDAHPGSSTSMEKQLHLSGSLAAPVVRSFEPVPCCAELACMAMGHGETLAVLLRPGDLLLLSGEARYNWTHGIIRDQKHQLWCGKPVEKKERVSITLRRLIPDE